MLSLFNVRSSPSINITHAHIVAQRKPIKDEYEISPVGKPKVEKLCFSPLWRAACHGPGVKRIRDPTESFVQLLSTLTSGSIFYFSITFPVLELQL